MTWEIFLRGMSYIMKNTPHRLHHSRVQDVDYVIQHESGMSQATYFLVNNEPNRFVLI